MNKQSASEQKERFNCCAQSGAEAVSENTCLKCGFKCIEGSA